MNKIYIIVLFILFALLPKTADAAALYFSPKTGSYGVGENFNVTVLINTDQSVSAISGVINFPTKDIEVVALRTTNSITNLWVQNPSFSNAGDTGNIRFEGVILNPGFIGSAGKIIDAVFRVKKIGSAILTFNESSILANDGLGTNINEAPSSVAYTFIEAKPPAPKETNSDLNKRVEIVENKIKAVESNPSEPVVVVQEVQPPTGVLGFWEVLPDWVKISVLILIGVTVLILLLIFVTLGIVILVWLWNYILRRKIRMKEFFKKIFGYLGIAGKEIEGDVVYSANKLGKEFRYAEKKHSLKSVLTHCWATIIKIIKRFFVINNK